MKLNEGQKNSISSILSFLNFIPDVFIGSCKDTLVDYQENYINEMVTYRLLRLFPFVISVFVSGFS